MFAAISLLPFTEKILSIFRENTKKP